MSTVKQRYEAVRPRERVEFGGFRFVIPSLNFQVPKFQCCNGAHEGVVEPEHHTDSFDLSECVKEVKSIARSTPSINESPATGSTCMSSTSQASVTSKVVPPADSVVKCASATPAARVVPIPSKSHSLSGAPVRDFCISVDCIRKMFI
ncbi:hypothetical protein GCK32_014145 [Trichostrongylus colubriformis]|uniref:Uncharacterized protein n=1 Tax=Trichostrongylus colubriformis TaxID=6319 RepID=A0AAN8GFC0_TRICO